MLNRYIPQPITFWPSLALASHGKRGCNVTTALRYCIASLNDANVLETLMPPFQIYVGDTGANIIELRAMKLDGLSRRNVGKNKIFKENVGSQIDAALVFKSSTKTAIGGDLNDPFYLRATLSTGEVWYSELILPVGADSSGLFPEDCDDTFVSIFSNSGGCDSNNMHLETFTGYSAYFKADFDEGTSEMIIEGDEDADGETAVSFRKWKKRWKIQFLGDEGLFDFLSSLPLYSTVVFSWAGGIEISNPFDFEVEVNYFEPCQNIITVQFSSNLTSISGCC